MKFLIGHLLMISLAAIVFVGCSGQDDAQQGAADTDSGTEADSGTDTDSGTEADSGTEPADSGTEPVEANTDDDPAPGTAVALPGDPGSISGAVKSVYVGLAQGVVYIVRVDEADFPPPEEPVLMDQKNLIFLPHVLPIVLGTTVEFPNSDTVRHNVFSKDPNIFHEDLAAEPFNLGTYDVGVVMERTSHHLGVMHLGCNVHTEMSAYILVCQNPYFATTEKGTGKFAIPNVPPGTWHLRLFHERLKPMTIQVEVKPGEETSVDFTDPEKI